MQNIQTVVFDWISEQDSVINKLSPEEQQVVSGFSILWSYFEARVCGTDANIAKLRKIARDISADKTFDPTILHAAMDYFRRRFVDNGQPTEHFVYLEIQKERDEKELLEILYSDNTDVAKELEAALFIIYRFRNNLFHGMKWAYGIRGQKQNLTTAIDLMKSLIPVGAKIQGYFVM